MSLHVASGSSTKVPHSIFRACLSSYSDSGIEKGLTPGGTFPLWICWICCTRLWYLYLARISLMVGLKTLDAILFRSSDIVFSRFESRLSSRFPRLSDQTCAPRVRRLSLSILGVSPIKSPASRASSGMVAARVIPTDWKLRSLHDQNSEPTWKQRRQSNVQRWLRIGYVHF